MLSLNTDPFIATEEEPRPEFNSSAVVRDGYPGFMKTTSPSGESESEFEDTIPPTNAHRTLVLCFDGTGKSSVSF